MKSSVETSPSSQAGIFHVLPKGKLTFMNDTLLSILGYSSNDELVKKNLQAICYNRNECRKIFQLFTIQGDETRIGKEILLKKKDNSPFRVSLGIHPVINEKSRKVKYYEGSISNIPGKKEMIHEYDLINFAFNKVREAVLLIDEKASIHYVNDNACEVLGYTRDEMLQLTVADIDPDFPSEKWTGHWNDLRSHGSLTFEGRHIAKDGRIFPVEINANYFEYKGHPYNLALIRDNSQRKVAIEALYESEQKLRTVFDTIEEALTLNELVYDDQGEIIDYRIIEINPAFELDTGLTREQVIGMTATQLYGMSSEYINDYWGKNLNSKNPIKTDMYIDQTNQWKHILTSIPVNGRFIITHTDITERKHLEETLQESEKRIRHKLDAILSPEGDISILELSDIIDTEQIQRLMDEFYQLTHIGIGIIDLKGNVLVGTGWQDICTKFHRINPASCQLCKESDLELSRNVPVGTFKQYLCKNNMWDIATPIMLGDRHVGNIFLGQFLFDDETPNYEVFRRQALRFGFDERHYLMALDKVPRWSHETVNAAMSFYTAFARMIGNLSYSNIKLAHALEERKQKEEALRLSEQLFRTLVEHSPDFIARYDCEFRRIYVNPAILKLFGSSKEDVIGKTPAENSPIYAPQVYIGHIQQVIETATENTVEIPFRTPQGEMHWGHMRFVPEFGSDGKTASVLAIGRDIHEIKESEQQFRRLAENFPDFIIRFDRNFRYTYVNPAVEKAFDMPAEAFIGKTLQELPQHSPPEQNDVVLALIRRAFNEGVTNYSEVSWDTQAGKRIFEIHHVPEKDATGNVVTVLGIARDVTERKHHLEINTCRLHLMQYAATNSLDELLEETLNEAEKLTGSLISFYHFVEDDQVSLTLQNWSRRTKAEFCKAEGKGMHYPINDAGVWVECVAQRKPVIHDDYASLPHRKGLPEGHATVIRELVVPVVRGEKIMAILGVGNKLTDYTETDIESISLLADLAWEIAERKRTDEALFVSENKYRTLIQKIQAAIVVHGTDTQIITCNRKSQELLGLSEDQLLGRTAYDPDWYFFREDNSVMPLEEYPANRVMTTRKELRNYIVGIHRPNHDNDVWVLVNADPVFGNKDGINQVIVTFIDITSLKKIEEELRQSEERFRRLAENARDVIYRMSLPDGKYEYVSPAAYSMFGYYPEEFYTNPLLIQQEIHPGWHKYFEEQWINLLKGEMPPTYEYQIIHKSGEVRWLNQRNILVLDENGNPIAIEGIVTDITEQKHIEDVLRVNEDRYQMAQTISHTGNWEYNLQTTHFWGSDEAKRIYGFDLINDSFTTEDVENCIPERERIHQALVDLIQENKPYNLEFEIHTKNSSESRIITSIAELQRDEQGNPLRVVGVIQDISERKRAEEAIESLAVRLNEAQHLTQIGSWELDLLSNSLVWTDEIYRIFEVDPDKFGASYEAFLDTIHPDDRETVDLAYTNSLKTRTPYSIDHRLLFTDGRIKYVHERCVTYFDGDKPVRSTGTVQDITERWLAEVEIQKLNRDLEQRVIERTSQLEAANKELEAFSYSVSHDLRAPLRHIDGFIELLVKETVGSLDEQSLKYMNNISDAAKRMGKLIDDLLSFSRMARHEISSFRMDFNALVQEVIQEMTPDLANRNIKWKIAEFPEVTGERSLLRVVMVNLISNAIKFTGPRKKTIIEIGYRKQDKEHIFFVRDNGVGFDPEYAGKLFGVFQRLHRSDEFEGTGIGLASVQRIIHRHGGETWAESAVNKGATFYFSLYS